MSNTVTLTISDELYDRARRLAEASAQTIERVLADRLEVTLDDLASLLPDEQSELAALQHLSDEALRTIADERFPQEWDARQQFLGDRNSRGTIAPDEYDELGALVERGNRLMLRKAEARAILVRRTSGKN